MFAFSLLPLAALLAIIAHALANGIPVVVSPNLNISTNPNVTAHIPSCTNLTTDAPTPYCYTKLQETAYLTNWNLTSPELCAPDEAWSTCFLRSVYKKPGPNCTTLTNNSTTCQQYNCTSLSLSTPLCPQPTTPNNTNTTTTNAAGETVTANNATAAQTAQHFYGAWSVYALQHHISTWSAALSANTSSAAILAALNPRSPNTATALLTTLIPKYGLDSSINADAALVQLLLLPRANGTGPERAYGNSRGRGERSSLSGREWGVVLGGRLGEVLGGVMGVGGFETFLGAVEGGAFSARGLEGVGELRGSLDVCEEEEG